MADFNKTVDLDKGLNQILDKIDRKAEELHRRGEEVGESFGDGWDDGFDYTVKKIQASSIKTEKAFKNLSDKIRKQVQQLATQVNGKDFKLKIDFSDIDMNTDDVKQKVAKIVKDFSTEGLIEFDTKGSEQQFKNLMTLYVKYQEKLNKLQGVAPNLTSSKEIELNLRQQLILALKLREIYSFLDRPDPIHGYSMEIKKIADQLVTVQKVIKQTQGGDTKGGGAKVAGDYDELAKVLKEIQGSLKVISDTFQNENNSMKAMAESGKTSFESLSQAIIEVYNNLTQVQSLVDTISQKDFNITNITQTGGKDTNLQVMKQQMAIARDTMEHLRQLYDQASETLTLLGQGGQIGLVMEYAQQLQELNLTDINKSVKGANTEMKLASVVAEMQDYIDKLTQINELRNKYNLGTWKDTFVPTQKSVVKPTSQPKQVVETPVVVQPQNTVVTSNTEAQQMWQLKAAIDEVTDAIGRKNAGFIKEKEIVDTSVEAEKAKLRELVDVITAEIGNALDGIKEKFAQSFVVPELDKNNLQASFDEIYNKFVELKDKIGTMQIDVGINSANITTAIQEALYAKDIATNYRKAGFYDLFDYDLLASLSDDKMISQLTGEVLSKSEAEAMYNANPTDYFVHKDSGRLIGDMSQVMQDFISRLDVSTEPEQNNWAQVIVEAINTQGGKIVESIKLLIPKSITDNVDDSKLIDAFETLTTAINDLVSNNVFYNAEEYFKDILLGGGIPDSDVQNALVTLGLMTSSGKRQFKLANTGSINEGTVIGDKFVISTQPSASYGVPDIATLMEKQNRAYELGAAVPRIIAGFEADSGNVFQLQTKASGTNHREADSGMFGASPEQIDRLIYTFEKLIEVGLYPEFGGDNVMYDPNKGFTVIDLDLKDRHRDGLDNPDNMIEAFLDSAKLKRGGSHDEFQKFKSLVQQRYALSPDQRLVNADTIAAERVAQQTQAAPGADAKITPIMDEGAVAKVVADNVAKTPATIKVTPVIDGASDSEQAIDGESQSATDAAKQFIDAANAKREFVDANKLVAESAKESANAVKQEAESISSIDIEVSTDDSIKQESESHQKNTEAIQKEIEAEKELARVKDIYDNNDELRGHEDVYKYQENKAIVEERVAQHITKDADGNEVSTIITTIVKDFEKFNKEEKKTEENIARAQSKLDEFIKKFKSKTGGNAQFIEGFDELSKFKIDKDNIEDALNKMTQLQAKYNELEGNFRKGQSSLNPFTNAITKASNIDNIFGEVEYKFDTLVNKSAELTEDFERLRELSASIKDFVNIINTDPSSITSDAFSNFSKDVGEFNLLKTQVEGTIKRDRRKELADTKEQEKAYAEILRLVKERNKFLATAEGSDQGSIKQRNALMDAYKVEQQLSILGKQIVLTDEQRAELARVREEQARKIRDIEVNNKVKADNQKATSREQKRKKEVEDYIKLIKQKNDYEAKAAKGGAMQPTYEAKVAELKEKIAASDKQSIMNQEEKNNLLAIEEAHQLKIAEIQQKKHTGKELFSDKNHKLQSKFEAGYLSEGAFSNWQNELAIYQSYLNGTVEADEATIKKKEASLTQLYDHLNKISNASRTFFASGGDILSTWFSQDQIQDAENSLMQLYEQLASDKFAGMETKFDGFSGANEQVKRLTFTVNDGKGALEKYTIALDTSSGATKLLHNNTKSTLTTLQKFGKTLMGDAKGLFSAFIGGMSVMYSVGRYFKEGIQYVRELDKALTELKKVTDETEKTYDRFLETAGKTSTRIGSTLSQMTSATAEFAKLGYDIQMASSMAESALVYANVGDNVDVETGSQSIISTMQAFGVETNNTMSIVDKFNEVGNNFAITTAGIGDALQVSASAMAEAGNTLDETIALTAAANTIVQNPNTVGTALKTLSLRIRGVKTELEEAGLETEGMAETTSQLQAKLQALTDGKVDIMVDANNFKSTTQILREMSEEWEHMTDVEQAAALELLGGKRQANTLSAIISNFDIVEDAIEASANSEGSALKENEKYLDSIEGRIQQFNNSTELFWSNLLDDEVIKMFVNLGTEVVKLASKFGELKSVIFAILMYFNVSKKYPLDFATLIFGKGGAGGIINNIDKIKSALGELSNFKLPFGKSKNKVEIETPSVEPMTGEQMSLFSEEYQAQIKLNEKIKQFKDAQKELKALQTMKSKDVIIPDDAVGYKQGNRRSAYLKEVLIPNKQAEIDALSKDIDDITNAANIKIQQSKLKLKEANDGQLLFDFDDMSSQAQDAVSEYYNIFQHGFDNVNEKLSFDTDILSAELDKLNNMDNSSIVSYMQSLGDLGDESGNTSRALAAYASTVKDGNYTLQGAQQYVAQHNAKIKASGVAAKAAAVGHTILNAAISMGVSIIISVAISAITSLINKQKELRESAVDTGKALKDQTSQLEDYQTKIRELRTELDSGNLSEVEAYKTREQLISIQQELIDNFGLEAKGINLVTGSIESQIKAIDDLNKKNAQVWLNENYKAINDAIDYLEESKTHYVESSGVTNWGTTDRVQQSTTTHAQEREHADVSVVDNIGIDLTFDGTQDEVKAEIEHWLDWFRQEEQILNQEIRDASAQNNQELVTSLQKDLAQTQDFIEDLSASYKKYFGEDSKYAQNKQIVEQAQQNTAITQYANQMSAITSAEEAYQEAIKSGNKTAMNAALEDINSAIEAASSDASANGQQFMVEFFDGMKKGYQDANFEKSLSEDKGLNDKVTKALGNFDDTLELSNTAQHTEGQKEAYKVLTEVAEEYGYEIEDLIKLLETLGKIKASPTVEVKQENTVDWEKTSKAIDDIQEAYDALTEAVKQYNSTGYLTLDNLQALLSLEPQYLALLQMENGQLSINQAAMEAMVQAKLAEAKANVITSTVKQLDTLATNAQAKAIATSTGAASGSIGVLGQYANAISNVGEEALLASGQILAFKAAIDGAETAGASEAEIKKIISNMNAQLAMIDSLGANLSGNFSKIVSPGSSSSEKTALEKLQEKYERKISNLDNQQTYLENEIERLEAENKGVSKSYYEEQIKIEEQKMALLQQQRTELTKLLNSTAKGSDQWWEVADALWEVEHSIQESTLRTIEFRESIADLYKTAFEDLDKAYGDKDDLYSDRQAYIEKYMELLELQGKAKPASAYLGLIAEEEAKLANSMAELTNLRLILAEGMASGEIEAGDERWVEMQSSIRETEAAILDSKVAIEQYKEELKSLKVEAFELVRTAFSNRNDYYTNQQDYIEGYIDYLEASGIDATPEMYEKLIDIEKEKRANYAADLADAYVGFAKIEAAGYTAADEEWVDANNRIVELEKGIQDCDIAMAQWAQNIRELEFEKFDYFTDRVSNINKELNNVSKLVEDEDVAFDDGTWTKEGITKLSMLYHEMENNNTMIAKYKEELADLEEQYKSGAISEKEYTERADDLTDRQWELIHSNEDIKDSIIDINEARIDLVEEGLNEESDAYRELIELKKEELEAERDLYDFKRDVEKQTKDIAELERKIAGLSGSDDASDIAERRKLEAQLREAKDGLNDTYYNHAKDSQSQALDDELEAYEKRVTDYVESLRETLEKTDEMIEQTFADVLLNADVTYQTLVEIANTYGPALSANLMNPWQQMGDEAVRIKDQISEDLLLLNDDNIATFSINAAPLLKQPFESGGIAAEAFKVLTVTQIDELQARINASTSAATRDFNAMISAATTSTHTFSNTVESKLTNAVNKAQKDAIKMENYLTYPWENGAAAANTWSDKVEAALNKTVQDYKDAAEEISKQRAIIDDTPSHTTDKTPSGGSVLTSKDPTTQKKYFATCTLSVSAFGKKFTQSTQTGRNYTTADAASTAAYNQTLDKLKSEVLSYAINTGNMGPETAMREWNQVWSKNITKTGGVGYAKGTLGTKRDEWAYTDEPWLGDEIVLVPGANGNLQYMRKGTAVMPADISANLVEWGKINPDMTALANGVQGVNLMSNYVSKPEVNVAFDSLVHVDHCDEGTLKDLEKMVDTKINQFSKQMNYAIKRYK